MHILTNPLCLQFFKNHSYEKIICHFYALPYILLSIVL